MASRAVSSFISRRAATASCTRSFHSVAQRTTALVPSVASSSGVRRSLIAMPVSIQTQAKRFLNLHEYQSKALMAKYNIRVQRGTMAEDKNAALNAAKELTRTGAAELVVKAQIHAGGRGKGHFNTGYKGGVHISTKPDAIADHASKMFGNYLITKQTGPEGQLVQKVLVHESINFNKEYYFAILMDRKYNGPVIVASPFGGMDIEEVAEKHPDKIFYEPIDINKGIQPAQTKRIAELLGFTGATIADAQTQMANLYNLFIGEDATQVEINPLVQTLDGKVYCVDAKINFDDNASFRHEQLFAQRDFTMEDPREVAAAKFNLNYIGLDGNIGCMVNGAGLAMATMDIIKLHGGAPANFLDVGGGANEQQVEEAFKILTADPKVKALLVNIFGGIMKCDTIATGIVNAARKVGLKIPLVVRLEGTNVDKGASILKQSGLKVISARNLDEAAKEAVKAIA